MSACRAPARRSHDEKVSHAAAGPRNAKDVQISATLSPIEFGLADAPAWSRVALSVGACGFSVPMQTLKKRCTGVKLGKASAGQSRRETELSNDRP